jgi:predicted molibdopterin-dependent oxidoreductase YjgC
MKPGIPPPEPMPLFHRLGGTDRDRVEFTLDGRTLTALAGDTVLTALLTNVPHLRLSEPSGAARAGFCLMGACQDCWVDTAAGGRVRACSTAIENGMCLVSDRSGRR